MSNKRANPDFWKQPVTITVPVLSLLAIHGNACLGLRHPANKGPNREWAIYGLKQIGRKLVKIGALTPEELKACEKLEAEEGSPEFENP